MNFYLTWEICWFSPPHLIQSHHKISGPPGHGLLSQLDSITQTTITHILVGHLPVGSLPIGHHLPEDNPVAPGVTGWCEFPIGNGFWRRPSDGNLAPLGAKHNQRVHLTVLQQIWFCVADYFIPEVLSYHDTGVTKPSVSWKTLLPFVIRAKEGVKYIPVQNGLISSRFAIDLSIYNMDI